MSLFIYLFTVKTQQGLFHYRHSKSFGLWLGFDVRSCPDIPVTKHEDKRIC